MLTGRPERPENTASRYKSRLGKRVGAMKQGQSSLRIPSLFFLI
jgi:hypothetical protein